jgi:hypothetical protein
MSDKEQLQALHDSYVWEVNAAVGEGRLDLVWQLADDYLDEALAFLTSGEQSGCDRPDCAVCRRPRQAPAIPRRRVWGRRKRGDLAS